MDVAASRRETVGRWAERLGKTVRVLREAVVVRSIPGWGGAIVFCYGVGQIYHPLTWVFGGLFLLLADSRMST